MVIRGPEVAGMRIKPAETWANPNQCISLHLIGQKCDTSVHSGGFVRRINRLRGGASGRAAARRDLAKIRTVEDIACFQRVARNGGWLHLMEICFSFRDCAHF